MHHVSLACKIYHMSSPRKVGSPYSSLNTFLIFFLLFFLLCWFPRSMCLTTRSTSTWTTTKTNIICSTQGALELSKAYSTQGALELSKAYSTQGALEFNRACNTQGAQFDRTWSTKGGSINGVTWHMWSMGVAWLIQWCKGGKMTW